ncbi:MAG: imidazolonepropionase [Bacteroidetes bacterium GWE2_39_28]|nr:MAG: imidazolonepropionase [Bacteroidetes bacterium GWE2_39_28]OFY14663.1 MAG: imidazolonepropionase [Bacteroidetes bacterium GWF2_39_10]OFZ12274.1 MAG: imidazolonepropionase [Bacteroidetes bacterium RIFOXYC2_FULL_39_11]HCT94281.1 imidazolonepropionase [Rikenellaceae bacterium]
MSILIINIKQIVQVERDMYSLRRGGGEMSVLDTINNGFIFIEGDSIRELGEMPGVASGGVKSLIERFGGESRVGEIIDATDKFVFPSYCDSHTHLVYAGSREGEFTDKIRGLTYQEIAKRGGGILNSAALLHQTSEDELYRQSIERAWEIIAHGTGAVEIKSGYGLNTNDELKMLKVAKRIAESTPLSVKSTFLGAHAVPEEFRGRREEYVNEIISVMIPLVATEELAEYIDVFTEEGFFSVEDTDRIFNAAIKYGLRPKIHANQMSFSGGVGVAVKYNAISADHLEFTAEREFDLLLKNETVATLLPGSTFFLEMEYAPARKMINHGLTVALATNYNPGSSPYSDMKFIMGLAALKMKMTPEEVINAATLNGAAAMGLSETHGTIAKGKTANLFITRPIPSYSFIPYALTTPVVETVILNGTVVNVNDRVF